MQGSHFTTLFLLLILAAPLALAADVPPPDALAVTVGYPERTELDAGTQIAYDVYVNFTRSSADNGTNTYNVCREDTDGVFISCANNTLPTNISNRPGWASFHDTGAYVQGTVPFSDYWRYNVSINKTTFNGVWTEQAAVHLNISKDHDQVGPNASLNASNIVDLTVYRVGTTSQSGLAAFNFTHSSNDPNESTTGDFSYWIFEQFSTQGTPPPACSRLDTFRGWCQPGVPSQLAGVWLRSPPNTGTNGTRSWDIEWGGTGPTYLAADATPVDDRTGLWGNTSCLTVIDMYRLDSSNTCGVYTDNPNLVPTDEVPQLNATFPGLDVPAFITATGLTMANTGYMLAAILIAFGVITGFAIGGGAGAGIAGALCLALTYPLGLLPPWLLILITAAAATVIVLLNGSRQQ